MGRGITFVRGQVTTVSVLRSNRSKPSSAAATSRSCSRTRLRPHGPAVRRFAHRVACHDSHPATFFRLSGFTANSSKSEMVCDVISDAKFTPPPFWRSCDGVIDLRVRIANQSATSGHVPQENSSGILLAQCCRYQTKETPIGGNNHVQSRQQTRRG